MIEELIIRTLCDTLPSEPFDAIFLFGQTEDNQQSVFDAAVHMLRNKQVVKVMFIHSDAMSGYPGFEAWQQKLLQLGVQQEQIEPVPVAEGTSQLNTRIEAEAAIGLATAKGFKRIAISAAPFQQPRAFMAAVTAALQHPSLQVYSYPGRALSWNEEVKHSQGEVTGTRAGLISGEMERIRKYTAKGDLAEVEEVLNYLNRRDRDNS